MYLQKKEKSILYIYIINTKELLMSIRDTIIGEIVKNVKIKWDILKNEQANDFIDTFESVEMANKEVTYD